MKRLGNLAASGRAFLLAAQAGPDVPVSNRWSSPEAGHSTLDGKIMAPMPMRLTRIFMTPDHHRYAQIDARTSWHGEMDMNFALVGAVGMSLMASAASAAVVNVDFTLEYIGRYFTDVVVYDEPSDEIVFEAS